MAIQALAAATVERSQRVAGLKISRPAMKQPTFNWETENKCNDLKIFKLEVNNILTTCNTPQAEQLAIVKNWLGRKCLQFLETLTNVEKVMCSTLEGLFKTLTNRCRLHFNETKTKSAEEWMGRL